MTSESSIWTAKESSAESTTSVAEGDRNDPPGEVSVISASDFSTSSRNLELCSRDDLISAGFVWCRVLWAFNTSWTRLLRTSAKARSKPMTYLVQDAKVPETSDSSCCLECSTCSTLSPETMFLVLA